MQRSEVLQQALDIFELKLRTCRLAETTAQLFENAARTLHVDFARHFQRLVIAVFAPAQRPPERIGLLPGTRLPLTARLAGTGAKPHLLLHHLREILRATAQRFERAALPVNSTICIALAERAFGVTHGVAGAAERIELATTLPLALLALLTLLAETTLLEFFQQLLQLVAERLLILFQLAVLIALLAVGLTACGASTRNRKLSALREDSVTP